MHKRRARLSCRLISLLRLKLRARHYSGLCGRGKASQKRGCQYDSPGQLIKKKALTPDSPTPTEKTFQWQGLRLLQEQTPEGQRLYFYEPNNYAPLARIDDLEGKEQKTYYFHTDQIGTPLEMSDVDGRIVWQATFKAWGELQSLDVGEVEQNLRYQGQYFDAESGLHYNTFRYYDPTVGRFTTQDPIGLLGGDNLYWYAPNANGWIDPLGWCSTALGRNMGARAGDGMANHHLIPEEIMKAQDYRKMFVRLKSMGFNGDGASNGIFLPDKTSVKTVALPGHWSNHNAYTSAIESKVRTLSEMAPNLSDTQLVLGVKKIQDWARAGLQDGIFKVDTASGRLL
jgi:RHS repeat-associated protein